MNKESMKKLKEHIRYQIWDLSEEERHKGCNNTKAINAYKDILNEIKQLESKEEN